MGILVTLIVSGALVSLLVIIPLATPPQGKRHRKKSKHGK